MSGFAVDDLRPAEIESYLASRNWKFVRAVTHGSVWEITDDAGDYTSVLVPREAEFADYERRLMEVVQAIESFESRPEHEVLRDLIETSADVIRFQLPHTFADESVRFSDALTVFQRAKEAMRAAALSTVEPRPAYAAGAPHEVESFLRDLRLGHTERGSYVVPVIAPLGTVEPSPEEVVPRTDEPFGRFVTLRLSSALAAMESALNSARASETLVSFADAVAEGVSANLCNAVAEMARVSTQRMDGDTEPQAVVIRFSWSATRPVQSDVRSSFAVNKDDAPVLQDASEFLKSMAVRRRATITGQVVRLERHENQPDGSIGIRGEIEGEQRMVVVRLPATDYAKALHAHDLRLEVTCSGVLERHGTHSTLVEPIEFHAPESLF